MDHIPSAEGFSLAHLRYLVIDEADRVIEMAETGWLKAFVGRFTTPAELSESFNVVAPQPLKPLLMHNLLRQPDWRRSLVLVNWNEAAHQLELPLSVLGAREAEFPGARLMAQAGKVDGRVRETPVPLYELRQYEATYVSGFPR
ncbi:DEAD-box ATP-dependent RNA helicase 1 [Amphibalanus amphitrite]|uniref:DEAD-box ATP-dependent RNA helicase 1 n=1 Tax=Amphibalanus amphitrite TaxID=1232801 RepID=A0A6A4WXC8_AMPAM|nr:DEAD-box ATP-dependent RNA helicase 1 [Amphibalanus amphitrite]KAF0297865.1 DEAD-box ATP-dependent RNA helicase 1 [Amphibalanus amphitrite]KAF0309939.1 DEAD-box ATP-dependent RNA helicase 1 [Amphibalanus amphitrite]